jgi:hypothetical protein
VNGIAEVIGLGAAAVGLGMAGSFVLGTVRRTRRAVQRGRRKVEPARVRTLQARALVAPSKRLRRDLAQDVLRARQAFELARKDGRPVADLEPTLLGLERVARSLDVDLRVDRPVEDEVARTRKAARSLVEACSPAPGRATQLDEVAEEAERARLVAEARRELP